MHVRRGRSDRSMVPKLPEIKTVWQGHNEQSIGQLRLRYPKPIAEILSNTHRKPWTRALIWTIHGHDSFENSKGENAKGLTSSVFHWEIYFEHRFRPPEQVVSSEQQNRGHVLRSYANLESNFMVAKKPFESQARSQLRGRRHVDHDKFQLCDDQKTGIHHELGRQDRICS